MASEIRVNKITHTAGVGTITTSADGVVIAGIVTANNFSGNVTGDVTGSGANLTNVPAGQLTGTVADARLSTVSSSKLSGALPAISAANLTNLPAANITGTLPALDGSALTGVGLGTDGSANTSGIITATAFVSDTPLSHRNLIINGDFTVAQRATSSTSEGYGSVDRFRCSFTVPSENPTQSQVDVSSGTTPYTLGFRKAFKIQNGNQTSIATNTNINLMYRVESQDIANSGWNYTSSSSSITLSFWIKASVAQNYYGFLLNEDTSQNVFPFETGTLTADTWTKIIKTIPGNSNLTFNNDTGAGLRIAVYGYLGTGSTGSMSLDTWVAYNHPSTFTPNNTNTWITTNDATLEFTGFQLELGPVATPFEHISFQENFRRCCRYYWRSEVSNSWGYGGYQYAGSYRMTEVRYPVAMRATPTSTVSINHGGTGFAISKEQYKAWTNKSYSSGDNVHTTSAVFDAEI